MKKVRLLLLLATALLLMMVFSGAAWAHQAGPCNDSDGDGSASGQEYAEHHIVPMAKSHQLGNDGHKPGAHHGFSACQP